MLHTLLFVGIYILGFILTFSSNGVFSFILYETVYFFNPLDRWWSYNIPNISYSFYTVILMFFAVFIKSRKQRPLDKLLSVPQFKWAYLLVLLYFVAWLYAVHPEDHLVAANNYLKLIIIISLAYKLIDTSRNLDYVLWGYVFGSWYISFLIWQSGRNYGDRVEGIGTVDAPDANGIAAAIAPSLVICLYYFWISRNKIPKFLFVFAGVFIANAIVLINSRGSFLASGSSILFFMYYMYFSSFQKKYQKRIAIAITLAGLSGILYLIDDLFIARIQTLQTVEVNEEQETAATRIIFWSSAWEVAKDHPLGSGYRGFDYHAPFYLPEGMDSGFSRNRSVHSTWFEALTEIGYLGLLFLIFMMYSCIKSIRTSMSTLKEKGDFDNYFKMIMLHAALISYLVSMTFMNRFRAELLYWLILYSACAYNIYVIKSPGRNESKKIG